MMKNWKRKIALTLALLLAVTLLPASGCGTEYGIEAEKEAVAELGSYYTIPDAVVSGSGGKLAEVSVTDHDGGSVAVEYRQFIVAKPGQYTIRYYYRPDKNILAEAIQTLTVSDSGLPYISVQSQRVSAAFGEEYVLPEVEVYDILDKSVVPEITVTAGADERNVEIREGKFTVEVREEHRIHIRAVNSRGKTSEKTLSVYVRREGELESADREFLRSDWGIFTDSANLSFQTEPEFVKAGAGAFRFNSDNHNIAVGRPKMILKNPAVADFSGMTEMSFWLKNNGTNKLDIETLDSGANTSLAKNVYPGMWTKVTVTKSQLAGFTDWAGQRYNVSDMTERLFNISFYDPKGTDYDVCFDEFRMETESMPRAFYPEPSRSVSYAGEHTLLAPSFAGGSAEDVRYDVYDCAGSTRTAVSGGTFQPVSGREYDVIATVTAEDGDEYQAVYRLSEINPLEDRMLVKNGALPDGVINQSAIGTESFGDYLWIGTAGWGSWNQVIQYTSSLKNRDTAGFHALSIKVRNVSAHSVQLKLSAGAMGEFDGYRLIADAPADGEWHTYVVLLSDLSMIGRIERLNIMVVSNSDGTEFAGTVHIKDMILLTEDELG